MQYLCSYFAEEVVLVAFIELLLPGGYHIAGHKNLGLYNLGNRRSVWETLVFCLCEIHNYYEYDGYCLFHFQEHEDFTVIVSHFSICTQVTLKFC